MAFIEMDKPQPFTLKETERLENINGMCNNYLNILENVS
jgi:hypothetical protein